MIIKTIKLGTVPLIKKNYLENIAKMLERDTTLTLELESSSKFKVVSKKQNIRMMKAGDPRIKQCNREYLYTMSPTEEQFNEFKKFIIDSKLEIEFDKPLESYTRFADGPVTPDKEKK